MLPFFIHKQNQESEHLEKNTLKKRRPIARDQSKVKKETESLTLSQK